MANEFIIEKFVENIVKTLIDYDGEDATIDVLRTTKNIIIQINIPKEYRGRIIGKKGMVIDSIKVLTIGVKNTYFPNDPRKIKIELIEDENFLENK